MNDLSKFCLFALAGIAGFTAIAQEGDRASILVLKAESALKQNDLEKATDYLIEAGRLGSEDASLRLANFSFEKIKEFGATPTLARLHLLKIAKRKHPSAGIEMAIIYQNRAHKDIYDLNKAREVLKELSYRPFPGAWLPYARMCLTGKGGEVDLVEAYFFVGTAIRTTDPESLKGLQLLELRASIDGHLPKSKRIETLRKMDFWLDQHSEMSIVGESEADLKSRLRKIKAQEIQYRNTLGLFFEPPKNVDPFSADQKWNWKERTDQ